MGSSINLSFMQTPSNTPELNLKGLSVKQIQVLDRLKEIGKDGADQHGFYMESQAMGIDDDGFTELVTRKLITPLIGKRWAHPEFATDYNPSNHRDIATNVARVLSSKNIGERSAGDFMDTRWIEVIKGLPQRQINVANRLQNISGFRRAVTTALQSLNMGMGR